MDDLALAIRVVRAAGEAVLALGDPGRDAWTKGLATDVVTAADEAAEAAALELLARERPGDGVVSEEGAARPADGDRTWVLDPLDGTLNFAAGLPGWCVAVALLERGEAMTSAVWDPIRDELYSAAVGAGARLAGSGLLRVAEPGRLADATVATFVDRGRRPATEPLVAALAAGAGTLRMTGCGTLELAWVAAGRLHGWVQPDVEPWDWHPGALLVREAGGRAEVVNGSLHVAAAPGLFEALAMLAPQR